MENGFERPRGSGRTDDLTTVVTSLEADQLSAAKRRYQVPRRRLTTVEVVLFWSLRIYLIFMFGVVLFQVWESAH